MAFIPYFLRDNDLPKNSRGKKSSSDLAGSKKHIFSVFKPDPDILKVENKGFATPYFNSRGHKVEGRGFRAQSESFFNRAHDSHMEFAARKHDLMKSWRR